MLSKYINNISKNSCYSQLYIVKILSETLDIRVRERERFS